MKKFILLAIYATLLVSTIAAQEEAEEEENTTTIYEQWEETLLYGIEESVLGTITEMIEQKDDHFAEEVLALLQSNRTSLQTRSLDFFEALELDTAIDAVVKELEFYQDISSSFTTRLIQHLQRREHPIDNNLWDLLREIIEEEGRDIQLSAIGYVGNSKLSKAAPFLVEFYDDPDIELSLQESVLRALGKIRDESSRELIFELATDDNIDKTLRIAALGAAGAYGDEESLEVLGEAFSTQDPLIRGAAVSAFTEYPIDLVGDLYLESLRDGYWRIRLAALKGIETNPFPEALGAVRYMAMKDPETNIRHQALRTLAGLDNPSALEFMRETLVDEDVPDEYRMSIAVLLIQNNFRGSRTEIETVMIQEWEEDESRLLDAICKELSISDLPGADDLYQRMLGHDYFIIQIYGVRGIGRNKLLRFREDVQAIIDSNSTHPALKTNARNALEQL